MPLRPSRSIPSPRRRRSPFVAAAVMQWLAVLPLGLGLAALQPTQLFGGLAIGLGLLTALKLLEARSLAEHRMVSLLQLLCTGLVAAQRPELAASLLQLITTLLALAGLLALELGEGLGWLVLLRRTVQVLLASLPLALVLFVLVPRLGPFSTLPLAGGSAAVMGLSDQLDPAGIAELASSDAPAARVVFPGAAPPPPAERYWRVLVHDRFDGRSWLRSTGRAFTRPVPADPVTAPAPADRPPPGASSQLWLAAPSRLAAVPWSGRGQPLGSQLRLDRRGELLHRGRRDQRRVYQLSAGAVATADWQRLPPTAVDLALPRGLNPRLEALAAGWADLPAAEQRLQAARSWYLGHDFRYSLRPGTLPARAPFDAFLFDRRIGFCGHYASSFTALMRAAGVPARVVSGYRGGRWVEPIGAEGYLDLRQSDAHAWSEVWLPGQGWRAVDPSTWVRGLVPGEALPRGGGPLDWLRRQWWGLDIAWTRLWLGFDRDSQASLLRRLLGPALPWLGTIVLLAVGLSLAAALTVLRLLQHRSSADRGRRELERVLRLLRRGGLEARPAETLQGFVARIEQERPELSAALRPFMTLYLQQRFAPPAGRSPRSRALSRQRRRLARQLRGLVAGGGSGRATEGASRETPPAAAAPPQRPGG